MTSKISVIGCGWLGFPLAKKLIEKGFEVKGSTTSIGKLDELQNAGITPFQISISEDKIEGDINGLLEDNILIINIPPGLRKNPSSNFVKKVKLLQDAIKKSEVKKVVFVSSTSVYGNENKLITESTAPIPNTEGGKQLLQSEQLLKDTFNFQTTIVRFSGLIGSDRHPVKFLSGKKGLKNGNQAVNLVHLQDCINCINFIIENELWGEEFNISYPDHPTRKSYYTKIANEKDIPLPVFNNNSSALNSKVISSEKIQSLGFRFKKPI